MLSAVKGGLGIRDLCVLLGLLVTGCSSASVTPDRLMSSFYQFNAGAGEYTSSDAGVGSDSGTMFTPDGEHWVLYEAPPGDYARVVITASAEQSHYWLAYRDEAAGRWQWSGPYDGSTQLEVLTNAVCLHTVDGQSIRAIDLVAFSNPGGAG